MNEQSQTYPICVKWLETEIHTLVRALQAMRDTRDMRRPVKTVVSERVPANRRYQSVPTVDAPHRGTVSGDAA